MRSKTIRFSNKVRYSNKVRFGITKKRSFRGGGDCGDEITEGDIKAYLIKRNEVYGEDAFTDDEYDRIIKMVELDRATKKSLDFSGVTPLNVTDLNAGDDAKVNEILDNSAINLFQCHGGINTSTEDIHKVVPSNTIICFLGVMDHFTVGLPFKYETGTNFLKQLTSNKFAELFKLRTQFNKNDKYIYKAFNNSYEAFRNSTWYYPGDIYPDIDLSLKNEDKNRNDTFIQWEATRVSSGSKKTIQYKEIPQYFFDCGKEVGNSVNESSESYVPPKGECLPFISKLSDGLRKMKLTRPFITGFRLYIFNACRGLYNFTYFERRNFLEYEMYFQHKNSLIDKQCNKDKKKNDITKYQRESWYINTLNMTYIISARKYIEFKNKNAFFNYNWYNGRTPSLIDENYDYKKDKGTYLSTFSINKIIKYLIKKGKDEAKKEGVVPKITPLQFFIKNNLDDRSELYNNSGFCGKIDQIIVFLANFNNILQDGNKSNIINNIKSLLDCISIIFKAFQDIPKKSKELKNIKCIISIKDFIRTKKFRDIYKIIHNNPGDMTLSKPEDFICETLKNTIIINSESEVLDSYGRLINERREKEVEPYDITQYKPNIVHIIFESPFYCDKVNWSLYEYLHVLEINNINKNIYLQLKYSKLRFLSLRGSSLEKEYEIMISTNDSEDDTIINISIERVKLKNLITLLIEKEYKLNLTDCIISPSVDFKLFNKDIYIQDIDFTGVNINSEQCEALFNLQTIKSLRLRYFTITDVAVGTAGASFSIKLPKCQFLEIISNDLISFNYDELFSSSYNKDGLKVIVYNCENSQENGEVVEPKSKELMNNKFTDITVDEDW